MSGYRNRVLPAPPQPVDPPERRTPLRSRGCLIVRIPGDNGTAEQASACVRRVFPLRTYNLPDIGDHLIHFTGGTGGRFSAPEDIRNISPADRLAQILYQGRIRAAPTPDCGRSSR